MLKGMKGHCLDEWEEMAEDSGVGIVAVRSYFERVVIRGEDKRNVQFGRVQGECEGMKEKIKRGMRRARDNRR